MKVTETRGRKRKHNYPTKKGQVVSFKEPNNKLIQIMAINYAKKNQMKFTTWNVEGELFIKRIA